MKTKTKINIRATLMVALFCTLLPCLMRAQPATPLMGPPYNIVNNLNCSVRVEWNIYDNTSASGAPCATSPGVVTIAAHSNVMLGLSNFGTCSLPFASGGDIVIHLVDIGGTTVSVYVDYNNQGPVTPLPTNPCTSNGEMTWTDSSSVIDP